MAGESAREVARRRREKAQSLQRMADAYERGAEGEEATAAALELLPSDEWTVFHDIAWPGRTYANIDHVVVGPGGVFVIDTKNWSGEIKVADDVLRQNGRPREKAVAGAAEAGLAVAELVGAVDVRHVHPVLCFVGQTGAAGWARDVMVCSSANVVQMITSRPVVLSPVDVRTASLELGAQLRSALASRPKQPRHAARHTTDTAATRRRTAKRAKVKRRARGDLIRLLVLAVVVSVVLTNPGIIAGMGQLLAKLVTPSN